MLSYLHHVVSLLAITRIVCVLNSVVSLTSFTIYISGFRRFGLRVYLLLLTFIHSYAPTSQ